MRFQAVVFGLFALRAASPAAAQASIGSERNDFAKFGGDVWATWTAPVRVNRGAVLPLGIVAATILAVVPRDSAIRAWMVTHPNTALMRLVGPFREDRMFPLDAAGSGQFLLPLSALAYGVGRLSHSPSLRDGGLGCAAAHLSSAALREVIYLSISRARPSEHVGATQFGVPGHRRWEDHSFLSGHIANSMACASFLAHRYGAGIGAAAMYAYPATIGLGRMADGWHWASDTIAGAALGYAIGRFIAGRQLTRESATATPAPASHSRAFNLEWSIAF